MRLDQVADALPQAAVLALDARGLCVHGYAWWVEDAAIVLVVITSAGGAAASYGVAVAGPTSAIRRAFCQAVHARVILQVLDYPGHVSSAERSRLAAAWHQGPAHLALLEQHAKPTELALAEDETSPDWLDHATRRFGHEPLVARCSEPDGAEVVKVLCPGAAVYRLAAEVPPCPVW
ncbi:MAG: hypothetical protein K2X97_21810 [Mycobacteriaceae bacterium]|nr:hypothetical protein [Mycobacteriaceae bacterium]